MAKMIFKKRIAYYKNYNEDWTTASQVIVAENGIFRKEKVNSFCFVTRQISEKEANLQEVEFKAIGDTPITLEEKPYMLKKIPHKLIETILKFYQVYAKKNSEVKINIWYDVKNEKFFLDAPFQEVTSVSVREYAFDHPDIIWSDKLKEEFPIKAELMERLKKGEIELVMETHSHHNMGCSFSGVDDRNDYFDAIGYGLFGVYITVMTNPRFQLRYFAPNTFKSKSKSYDTKRFDEVLFEEKDIIDYENDFEEKYDFNLFAKHVNINKKLLFGEPKIEETVLEEKEVGQILSALGEDFLKNIGETISYINKK